MWTDVAGWVLWEQTLKWSLECKVFRDQYLWKEEEGMEVLQGEKIHSHVGLAKA